MKVSVWNVIWFIVYCIICYFNYLLVSIILSSKCNDNASNVFTVILIEIGHILLTCYIFEKETKWINKQFSKKYKIF